MLKNIVGLLKKMNFLTIWKQFKKRTKNERAFYFAENIEEYKLDTNGNIILENV
ncbi:hypothetical protein [Fusobacterium varium]